MNAIEGLDETKLATLVESFYARVRADEELGPIFNDAIGDWPEHLDKLTAFWSSVMLTTGRYRDCQDFRVWAGIMGKKESHYVPTQGTGDTG